MPNRKEVQERLRQLDADRAEGRISGADYWRWRTHLDAELANASSGSHRGWGCVGLTVGGFVLLVIVGAIINAVTPDEDTPLASSPASRPNVPSLPAATSTPSGPQLWLEPGWGCTITASGSYIELTGLVTNPTTRPLRNVQAVALYYDANRVFVNSSSALIEYDPLLPGQTSPFRVLLRMNPAIEGCEVEFKMLLGGTIPFQER